MIAAIFTISVLILGIAFVVIEFGLHRLAARSARSVIKLVTPKPEPKSTLREAL